MFLGAMESNGSNNNNRVTPAAGDADHFADHPSSDVHHHHHHHTTEEDGVAAAGQTDTLIAVDNGRRCGGQSNGQGRGGRGGDGGEHDEACPDEEDPSSGMPFIMICLKKRLHLLPIVTAVFIFVSFIISYVTAVSYGHVEPIFPYISYTAIKAPERCLFAQLINMGALLLAANIYIRYKHVAEVLLLLTNANPGERVRRPRKLNLASLFVGLLSAFGLSMVANFQVTVEMRPWHYTGAGIAFVMGSVYCWLQTVISLRFRPWAKVTIIQFINSLVLSLFLMIFIISKIVFRVRKAQGHGTKWDTLRGVYLVSTISEWLTALAIVTYVLTFYYDFKHARLHMPRVSVEKKEYVFKNYKLRLPVKETVESPQELQAISGGSVA